MISKQIPTEAQEQAIFIKWCRINESKYKHLNLIHASMNSAKRTYRNAQFCINQGILKGVPDLFLPVPKNGFHGLFIEMKRKKGGIISKEQDEFIRELLKIGYQCHVCRGAEDAISAVKNYYF